MVVKLWTHYFVAHLSCVAITNENSPGTKNYHVGVTTGTLK